MAGLWSLRCLLSKCTCRSDGLKCTAEVLQALRGRYRGSDSSYLLKAMSSRTWGPDGECMTRLMKHRRSHLTPLPAVCRWMMIDENLCDVVLLELWTIGLA